MSTHNVDPIEINKFSELSHHWWDPEGELQSLHKINPIRLSYIQQQVILSDKNVIDIGCGGGLLAEGMAKLGAQVTGIDMSEASIKAAKLHQYESQTTVTYEVSTAEAMALKQPAQYDVVTCLEMLEHVPDPQSIIVACATLTKPGGDIFLSTLNRNIKSYLFAIVGAEYILKILPKNTHDFAKFIKPSELSGWARAAKLDIVNMTGMGYNPLTKEYSLIKDISVNYLVHLKKK